jgi:hypothetical protein
MMKQFLPIAWVGLLLIHSSCGLSGSLAAVRDQMPEVRMPSIPKIAIPPLPEIKRGDIARFSWTDLLPSRVPIVEVRKQDWEEMELGREKALAYQKNGGFFPSKVGSAVDFREPELPVGSLENPEYGLLPPKSESQETSDQLHRPPSQHQ